ncbi:MAG: hypothetical protein HUU38_28050 [Anaerolineales bacterium]|nr:hypothetical protein [Anaerolineales bacterium]
MDYAHTPGHLDWLYFGVATARRAWVEAGEVVNAWEGERLVGWLERDDRS